MREAGDGDDGDDNAAGDDDDDDDDGGGGGGDVDVDVDGDGDGDCDGDGDGPVERAGGQLLICSRVNHSSCRGAPGQFDHTAPVSFNVCSITIQYLPVQCTI